jgi:hypothetical protein
MVGALRGPADTLPAVIGWAVSFGDRLTFRMPFLVTAADLCQGECLHRHSIGQWLAGVKYGIGRVIVPSDSHLAQCLSDIWYGHVFGFDGAHGRFVWKIQYFWSLDSGRTERSQAASTHPIPSHWSI